MGHEFGHFITAKRAGMKVTDFFVGFGPVLWSTTVGETRYGVRAILARRLREGPGHDLERGRSTRATRRARTGRRPTRARCSSPRPVRSCTCVMALAPRVGGAHVRRRCRRASTSASPASPTGTATRRTRRSWPALKRRRPIVAIDGRAITSADELVTIIDDHAGQRAHASSSRATGHDVTLHATPVDGRRPHGRRHRPWRRARRPGATSASAWRTCGRAPSVRGRRAPRRSPRSARLIGSAAHAHRARLLAGRVLQPLPPGRVAGRGDQSDDPADAGPLSIVGVDAHRGPERPRPAPARCSRS